MHVLAHQQLQGFLGLSYLSLHHYTLSMTEDFQECGAFDFFIFIFAVDFDRSMSPFLCWVSSVLLSKIDNPGNFPENYGHMGPILGELRYKSSLKLTSNVRF